MSRKAVVLTALPLSLALIAAVWGVRIHAELASGHPVFWLADLWTPAAVFTVILVVCVDFVTARAPQAPESAPTRKARPRKGRSAK